MITYKAKKSVLYKELDKEKREHFFSLTCQKVIHNIDSLYYVIKLKNDWSKDEGCKLFKSFLEKYRQEIVKTNEQLTCFQNLSLSSEWIMNGIGSNPYLYDLGQPDKFLCFFIGTQLNSDTPEIWVQLRSQYLWLSGEHPSVNESLTQIEELLGRFDIEIAEVKENRIDYAYHTNYVQDPTSYFRSENINRMQKSRFTRGSLEFSFKGDFIVETDYLTLGRKKSNNLFFRIYDKTKEVIEQQYKQFFIKIWYMEKMINYFDLYCIEKAFLRISNTNYKYLDIARLEFYLEHGQDQEQKNKILKILNDKSLDYEKICELADILTPAVTKILNVEIETKRKYYYSMDESINTFLNVKSPECKPYAKKLYRILDNKQVFHNHLTCKNDKQEGVIRFLDYKAKNRLGKGWTKKDKYPTSDFWQRIQSTRVNRKYYDEDIKLLREYQDKLSIDIMKKKITNMVSTYSLYVHGDDVQNDTYHDVLDFMSTLNETDMEKAILYKQKKKSLLANRLEKVEGTSKLEKHFKIVDLETGESITTYE